MVPCAPFNTLLFSDGSARSLALEKAYVGPSRLRLRVRLARSCQPANWCVEEDTSFVSCMQALVDGADGG